MASSQPPVWFITGTSQGIGLALVRHVLARGHRVIASSRNPSKTPELVQEIESKGGKWVKLDTTAADVEAVLQQAYEIFGRIDIVINNAAYAVLSSVEEVPMEAVKQEMDTNFYGPLRIMKSVLPSMRKQRSGVIMNVSSTQGLVSAVGNGIYAASKHALEAASEALEQEVKDFGIRVVIVEPGAFKTTFGTQGAQVITPRGEYAGEHVVTQRFAWISSLDKIAPGDPNKAAKAMFDIATGETGRLRHILGTDSWKMIDGKVTLLRETVDAGKEFAATTDAAN